MIDLYEYTLGLDQQPLADTHKSTFNCEATWLTIEGNSMEELDLKSVDYPQPSNLSQPLLQYYSALTGVVLSDANHDIRVGPLL